MGFAPGRVLFAAEFNVQAGACAVCQMPAVAARRNLIPSIGHTQTHRGSSWIAVLHAKPRRIAVQIVVDLSKSEQTNAIWACRTPH